MTQLHLWDGLTSKMETSDGLTDCQTAHNRAGDPDYQKQILQTCALCAAEAFSVREAEAARFQAATFSEEA